MLRQLKYFQSVVQQKSFSAAAAENYISQSAISQQIQALERDLGFPLLERRGRSFTLTPAGEYFYQKSLVLTADYQHMCAEAARIAGGGRAALVIGCLRSDPGSEVQGALAAFSARRPEAEVSIAYGNHEELYELLRQGAADLVVNDQRRAFSGEYVNLVLAARPAFIEVPAGSPLARLDRVEPGELKNVPCILVASPGQREAERAYYEGVVGLRGEFLYAGTLEEARLLVIGRRGFLPVDGGGAAPPGGPIARVPLVRNGAPILRNCCAFWKKTNESPYIPEFAEALKAQFRAE